MQNNILWVAVNTHSTPLPPLRSHLHNYKINKNFPAITESEVLHFFWLCFIFDFSLPRTTSNNLCKSESGAGAWRKRRGWRMEIINKSWPCLSQSMLPESVWQADENSHTFAQKCQTGNGKHRQDIGDREVFWNLLQNGRRNGHERLRIRVAFYSVWLSMSLH